MASLYRTALLQRQPHQRSAATLTTENALRPRNCSLSRPNLHPHAELPALQPAQTAQNGKQEAGCLREKPARKYCLDKLKVSAGSDKFSGIRKDRSLKVMGKDRSSKLFNHTRVDALSNPELFLQRRPQNNAETAMPISIRRRVQLIKKVQEKRKMINKEPAEQPKTNCDVSLLERIDFCAPEQEKVSATGKIRSQNLLGEGLRKSSSSKMKALVKNPFERLMRLGEEKMNKKQVAATTSTLDELHESTIVNKLDRTVSTFSNRCEIQEMLAFF